MKTATNPQTGERVQLVEGRWIPIKTATNPQTGEKAEFIGGKWKVIKPSIKPAQPAIQEAAQVDIGPLKPFESQATRFAQENIFSPIKQGFSELFSQPEIKEPLKPLESKATRFGRKLLGPAGTIASGAIAEPIAGLVGLGSLPAGSGPATKNIQATREALTYMPKSQEGMQGLQAVGKIFQPLGEGMQAAETYLGEKGYDVAGPVGGAIGSTLPTAGILALSAGKRPQKKPSPITQAERDIAAGNQAGIKIMTSDVRQPGTFAGRWAQSVGEKVPGVGTGPVREAQYAQRVSAVRNLLYEFGADDAAKASDNVMVELSKTRLGKLNKYTGMKTRVIDKLNNSKVPVRNAIKEIDNQIAKLTSLKTDKVIPVINTLEDFKTAIQGQNLKNIELLRKQLGESFKAPELSSIRTTGEAAVTKIYSPLRDDMGAYIKAVGGNQDYKQWALANQRLSGLAGEINKGSLKAVLSKGDATPEVVKKLLFSKKPSEVRLLYKNLNQEGRAKARVAILQEAAEKSGGIDAISPDRFANNVKKLGESVGVFFSGEDLRQVQGLTRAIDVTKRSSQAALNPPTGVQVALPVGAAVLTDILGGAGAALGTGATIGLFARAYESAPVRNLLIKISKTKIGSPEEAALVQRVIALQTTLQAAENGQ